MNRRIARYRSARLPWAKSWDQNRAERRARRFGKPLWSFYFNGVLYRTAVGPRAGLK